MGNLDWWYVRPGWVMVMMGRGCVIREEERGVGRLVREEESRSDSP